MAQPSRMIANRYRLQRRLGTGSVGTVWVAEHVTLRKLVAVKIIHEHLAGSPEWRGRFSREARAAASVRSRFVVQVLDSGMDDGVAYLAMELLRGESLAERLSRVPRLTPVETARIIGQVARGLERVHELGIVHRDLNPNNILLVLEDDEEIVKVLDFGVAKVLGPAEDSMLTEPGAVLGTPFYMSPEQLSPGRAIDARADLWSLAVITFECLCGRKVFLGTNIGDLLLQIARKPIPVPSQIVDVPAGFDGWFARATQRDPSQRFQSAREMGDALEHALGCAKPPVDSQARSSLPSFADGGWDATAQPLGRASASSDLGRPSASAQQSVANMPARKRQSKAVLALGAATVVLAIAVVVLVLVMFKG